MKTVRHRLRCGVVIKLSVDDWRRLRRSGICWYAGWAGPPHGKRYGYVVGDKTVRGRRTRVYLQRWLMNAPERSRVFWRDGNHLNFQRRNLIVVPFQEEEPYVETMPALRPDVAGNEAGSSPVAHEGQVL